MQQVVFDMGRIELNVKNIKVNTFGVERCRFCVSCHLFLEHFVKVDLLTGSLVNQRKLRRVRPNQVFKAVLHYMRADGFRFPRGIRPELVSETEQLNDGLLFSLGTLAGLL